MAQPQERRARWLAPALLAIGIAGCAAAWILVAIGSGDQGSWMAVVAGLDAGLLLRFSGMGRGTRRTILALGATALTIAVSNWGIAATQLGRSIGVLPWISATKLGPEHAWTVLALVNTPMDWTLLAIGLVAAVLAAR